MVNQTLLRSVKPSGGFSRLSEIPCRSARDEERVSAVVGVAGWAEANRELASMTAR
jgi:hypothetical protein